jgi:nitrile hydratase accessory protein
MSESPDRLIADMEGEVALPRKNGELIFEAPWQARAFGMVVAANEREHYAWDEFREQLSASIGSNAKSSDPSAYYERWVASFESVLLEKGILDRKEIDARTAEFASGEREEKH